MSINLCINHVVYSIDPNLLPHMQVDRGAVKFVMSGANIMCPGLTSEGAKMDMSVDKDQPVAIMVEGKEHALGLGWTKMSAKDMYVLYLLSFLIFILTLYY
jgi:predicted RNA-binding protein (TIGR00451 family)